MYEYKNLQIVVCIKISKYLDWCKYLAGRISANIDFDRKGVNIRYGEGVNLSKKGYDIEIPYLPYKKG